MAGVAQLGGVVLLGPLVAGSVQHLKAGLQGRPGPSTLQRYRELRRLWRKGTVQPELAGEIYRLAPAVVVTSVALAAVVIPFGDHAGSWGLGHDAVVLVALFALGRVALALAAWDTGSGFSLMGASRDLTFAVFAEITLLLVVLLAARAVGGDTDLTAMSAAGVDAWSEPMRWCAALAFVLVAMAETGRQPFDNPDTHLELTMVHEGPLLEYAGRDLAALQWAADTRLWLMLLLGADLVVPRAASFGADLAVMAVAVAVLCIALAISETVLAKARVLRVPMLLLGGAALCVIGLTASLAQGAS